MVIDCRVLSFNIYGKRILAIDSQCTLGSFLENMDETKSTPKKRWYSIQEAAQYLDVGEPTLYRWMRDGKITFRKVGDSTRFWQEDLDSVMQVFHSAKDIDKAREVCPICHHDELIEGVVRSTGLNYFNPKVTKFWTLKESSIKTTAKMCARCGAVVWFGDTEKLAVLKRPKDSKESGS
jgi:excisionase family DNA binding protein